MNATKKIELRPNPNFYGVPTSSDFSAVHVPTPIYNRGNLWYFLIKFSLFLDPELLERIRWSDIDQQYRRNREQLKDLSFQVNFKFLLNFFFFRNFAPNLASCASFQQLHGFGRTVNRNWICLIVE